MNANPDESEKPGNLKVPRSLARAKATIILDSDKMRVGTPAKIYDLATVRLGLLTDIEFALKDMLKVHVENEIQRIKRQVRGIVREVVQVDDGMYRVQIELYARLTPLDVLLLKAPFPDDALDDDSLWI